MLNDFLTCPKMFYDRHILGKIQAEKSSALEFGTALHLGIRTILDGEDGTAPFLMYWNSLKNTHMQYYEHSWNDLKELAVESFLSNFKTRHAKKFTDFNQEVPLTMPFMKDHELQGTADFIGLYEGKRTIADWKTSSRAYKKNKIDLNLQMYIYSKMYAYTTDKVPEQIMYKVFNKKDGSINTIKKDLTPIYLDDIFTLVENTTKSMLNVVERKEYYHGADCYCERL